MCCRLGCFSELSHSGRSPCRISKSTGASGGYPAVTRFSSVSNFCGHCLLEDDSLIPSRTEHLRLVTYITATPSALARSTNARAPGTAMADFSETQSSQAPGLHCPPFFISRAPKTLLSRTVSSTSSTTAGISAAAARPGHEVPALQPKDFA